MAQSYYTLQEAAKHLDMPVDELKQMAQKGKIRSFQDRGNLRFRSQDVEELAKQRGVAPEPDLVLGDAGAAPPSGVTPPSGAAREPMSPQTPVSRKDAPEVLAFVGENADPGVPKSNGGPKSAKKPAPLGSSDSDVRLVADANEGAFSGSKDSNIKLVDSEIKITPDPLKEKSSAKQHSQLTLDSGAKSGGSSSSATKPTSAKLAATPQPVDSGVRLVPMDDASEDKLLGSSDEVPLGENPIPSATDSNVRLEDAELPPADSGEGRLHLTDDINLDAEIQKEQEKQLQLPSTRLKPKSALKLPTGSPYELSDADLELTPDRQESGPQTPVKSEHAPSDDDDFELSAQGAEPDGISEMDLLPAEDDLVPAEGGTVILEGDNSDFSLAPENDGEQVLDAPGLELTSQFSDIAVDNPTADGISLDDDVSDDFDLSLEVEDTPKPSLSQPAEDSEGDFELSSESAPRSTKLGGAAADDSASDFDLSLEADSASTADEEQKNASDSQFELSLDDSAAPEGAKAPESDSEFELTLDDDGNLSAEGEGEGEGEGEEAEPQVKSKKPKAGEEQDIFETDFEVPALDESDDATAADSELESSDFDLALDDSELAQDEESGSQVVALDEEAETPADSDSDVVIDEDDEAGEGSSEFADLDADVQVEDDAVVEVDEEEDDEEAEVSGEKQVVVKERLIEPAPWGVMPVIFMLPCVIIMFLVGILGYEFVQAAGGQKPPGPLTIAIGNLIDQPVTPPRK